MSRSKTRRVKTWVAAGGLLVPATLLGAAMTANATLPAGCTAGSGGEVTCTYTVDSAHHAGSDFTFDQPTGVTTLLIAASGASGGRGSFADGGLLTIRPDAPGGLGSMVTYTHMFGGPSGGSLKIMLGGHGGDGSTGPGTAGAGDPAGGLGVGAGAGGGGGSTRVTDVVSSTVLLRAAGGGGGGGTGHANLSIPDGRGGQGGGAGDTTSVHPGEHGHAGTDGLLGGTGGTGGTGGLAGVTATAGGTAGSAPALTAPAVEAAVVEVAATAAAPVGPPPAAAARVAAVEAAAA